MCNVGGADRLLRLVLGACLVALALLTPLPTPWQIVLGVAGGVALVTAAVRYCPLYALVGLNSCEGK
jgi:hypothetical protein